MLTVSASLECKIRSSFLAWNNSNGCIDWSKRANLSAIVRIRLGLLYLWRHKRRRWCVLSRRRLARAFATVMSEHRNIAIKCLPDKGLLPPLQIYCLRIVDSNRTMRLGTGSTCLWPGWLCDIVPDGVDCNNPDLCGPADDRPVYRVVWTLEDDRACLTHLSPYHRWPDIDSPRTTQK